MIKINKKDLLFAEILWVTNTIGDASPVKFHNFLHVLPDCVWASDGKSLHKLKKKQDLLPTGSFEIMKKTKTILWLEPIEFEQPTLPDFDDLDRNYSRFEWFDSAYWIDFCVVIRSLAKSQKIFNIEKYKAAHEMPGSYLTVWVSPKPGFPLVLKNDQHCEAVITAYILQ